MRAGPGKCLSVVNCHCLMMLTCWVDERLVDESVGEMFGESVVVSLIGLQERKKKETCPFMLQL